MANVIVRLDGEQETIRAIGMFEMEKKKECQTVVKKYANNVRTKAKQTVPVSPANRKKSHGKPGDLKASITSKYYFQGLGAMIMPAKPRGSHRGIVEKGTGPRYNKKGAYRGEEKAQPFMEPAKRAMENGYNADMERIFGDDQTI